MSDDDDITLILTPAQFDWLWRHMNEPDTAGALSSDDIVAWAGVLEELSLNRAPSQEERAQVRWIDRLDDSNSYSMDIPTEFLDEAEPYVRAVWAVERGEPNDTQFVTLVSADPDQAISYWPEDGIPPWVPTPPAGWDKALKGSAS